ncbi:Ubiquitin-fold modifier-conjugating enzyme [Quillaja saponaria]|uniref:Ubiquitin-fold modifier-conjugating enzyme n=1 Tax=Quillaja saponaria TaxID=32244 RepID=A0AAD7L4F4_QUISA|nr:Ubiquitin-fold modifier-conjugating enzyme [Quillaja saponaria]KAJ7951426.1 Ubiquitin-fold modifier-conjugating enzyme [Quillaja saponaria]
MKKSPVHPKYETSDYGSCGFDLHLDFCQFLDEARQHGEEANAKTSSVYPEAVKRSSEKEKKGKKSWKSSLVSWWKADKKIKSEVEPTTNSSQVSKTRRGQVSGPINGCYGNATDGKRWRPTSGPLTNLFNPKRKVENETPYVSLEQLTSSRPVQSFGPVYMVT